MDTLLVIENDPDKYTEAQAVEAMKDCLLAATRLARRLGAKMMHSYVHFDRTEKPLPAVIDAVPLGPEIVTEQHDRMDHHRSGALVDGVALIIVERHAPKPEQPRLAMPADADLSTY